jgi:hypothetical protein
MRNKKACPSKKVYGCSSISNYLKKICDHSNTINVVLRKGKEKVSTNKCIRCFKFGV